MDTEKSTSTVIDWDSIARDMDIDSLTSGKVGDAMFSHSGVVSIGAEQNQKQFSVNILISEDFGRTDNQIIYTWNVVSANDHSEKMSGHATTMKGAKEAANEAAFNIVG